MNIKKCQYPRMGDRQFYSSRAGFTLVELVVTIVIIGILSSLGGMFISRPIEGYIDLERRTELVDQAESALRRMQRDIRAALPNSVRIFDGGKGIEFLHVVDGGRYRRAVDGSDGSGNILDFTIADADGFDVLGGLTHLAEINDGDKVVVYNVSNLGNNNAYTKDNLNYLKKDATASSSTNLLVQFKPTPIQYPLSSPYQRFFIVDEAISYKVVGTELRRYSDYTIDNIPGPDSSGSDDLVAKFIVVADSSFTYNSSTSSRSGLVTVQLALEDTDKAPGERISIIHQVHVDNAP